MDFEKVLEKCGNYGRYQLVLLLLYGYSNIMSSMHYFSQTIISFTPDHWCHHQQLEGKTFVEIEEVYKGFSNPHCTLLASVSNESIAIKAEEGNCHRWFYKRENNYESVTTELNWVCDAAFRSVVGQSFYYLGSVVGTISFGLLADIMGRLPAIFVSTLSGGFGDFITSFVNDMTMFSICRFVSGLATDTFFVLMYILAFEYLNPKKRTFGLNLMNSLFYCFGLIVSPFVALWVQSWRIYLIISSSLVLFVFAYPLLTCESAHWLLTRQKYDRAVKNLKWVAKFNGRRVEENVFEEFVIYYKQKAAEIQRKKNNDTFFGMFSTPRLRKFIIILLAKSIIVTLSFDVISRNMEGLGSSPFQLFSITSLCYIPAGFTIILLQNKIGRKGMATLSLLAGGIITAITGFILAFLDYKTHAILLGVMVGLGRYGVVVAYDAEVQYCTEIVPTSVRGRAVANIHVMGYAFSFLTTYIIYLGTFFKPLPSLITSLLMFTGAGLCLLLPETLNKKLPETLADGEQFGLNEKWNFFSCLAQTTSSNAEDEANNNQGS